MKIKRYDDWKGSMYDFLEVGDYVDEDIVSHFIDVMPPKTFTNNLIQMGEPYSNVDGKNTYATLKRSEEGWQYMGNCFSGQTENKD